MTDTTTRGEASLARYADEWDKIDDALAANDERALRRVMIDNGAEARDLQGLDLEELMTAWSQDWLGFEATGRRIPGNQWEITGVEVCLAYGGPGVWARVGDVRGDDTVTFTYAWSGDNATREVCVPHLAAWIMAIFEGDL